MTTLVAILVFVAIFALAGILLARVAAGSGALFDLNSGEHRAWFRRFAKPGIPAARLDKPTMPSATITSAGAAGSTTDSDKDTDKKSAGSTINQSAAAPIEQLIETVNASLPQTQCAQCGYPGCRPYAAAIVNDDVPINQCPPGGEALIQELAQLLGKPVIAMDAERGNTKPPQVAFIDEAACIGCTLCIAACPVDAIVGASRLMHTVLEEQCTGCELCLPPCPVDCIALLPADTGLDRWRWSKPA